MAAAACASRALETATKSSRACLYRQGTDAALGAMPAPIDRRPSAVGPGCACTAATTTFSRAARVVAIGSSAITYGPAKRPTPAPSAYAKLAWPCGGRVLRRRRPFCLPASGRAIWRGPSLPARGAAPGTRPAASRRRRIDQTDRQIERLVCELYGLTEDEIKWWKPANGDKARSSGGWACPSRSWTGGVADGAQRKGQDPFDRLAARCLLAATLSACACASVCPISRS
jgi:hypothetical protein